MKTIYENPKPSKEEQLAAIASYDALQETLKELSPGTAEVEIEVEETEDRIKIPLNALKLLAKILEFTSQGKPFSIVPRATEMTTQAAAEILGCSRPHFVQLLETGEIPFTKVGKHRRVKYDDVNKYRQEIKKEQKSRIIKMMRQDEELGLYDT